MPAYPGPLRDEPLPLELHNTLYADRGEATDGLADAAGLRAWLGALADRLPVNPGSVDVERLDDFLALRTATREALHAVLEHRPISDTALTTLNQRSANSPESLRLTKRRGARESELRYHGATSTDVVLGLVASRTIALVSRPHAANLRACGAPGCVLMFLKDHPRREWCSAACGNRARQARHYARHRQHRAT
jgi:predicted RNA-binding Zn ribbon-like protein